MDRGLTPVIHTPLFGLPTPVPLDSCVCIPSVFMTPVWPRACTNMYLLPYSWCARNHVCWCDHVHMSRCTQALANLYQVCPQRCVSTPMGTCVSLSAGVGRCSPPVGTTALHFPADLPSNPALQLRGRRRPGDQQWRAIRYTALQPFGPEGRARPGPAGADYREQQEEGRP